MRRLVLAVELSLDGLMGRDGLATDWAEEFLDEHLVSYHRRIVLKAGVHAVDGEWSVERVTAALTDGGETELAPVVAQGGPAFCQELTRRRIVDEYRLTVHPVVLGEGDRLFTVGERFLNLSTRFFTGGSLAYVLVPLDKYRDRPPPLPWADLPGSERSHEDDDDPEP